MRSFRLVLCAVSFTLAHASLGQYQTGFVWDRQSDWTPGTAAGTAANNPSPDALGTPVWQYEWTTGGPLGSPNAWHTQPATRSVWDPDWFGSGQGAWVRLNDTNPPIFANRMTHNLAASSWDFVPMIRWLNPLGDCARIDVTGSLTIAWSGEGGLGAPIDVEVVIAMDNASNGLQRVLLGQRFAKPTPIVSSGESVTIPVDLRDVALDQGDAIVVSCRGVSDTGQSGRWIVLRDQLRIQSKNRAKCDETVVAVFGDYGRASPALAAVADLVTAWDPDLIITTGDNNYDNLVTDWDKNIGAFYGQYLLADRSSGPSRFANQTGTTQRYFPAVGNHDTAGPGGSAFGLIDYFHDRTVGPGRLPLGTGSISPFGVYYDFIVGSAHFWIVDSDHALVDPASMAAQKTWLQQGLAASTSQWNLVFFHHGPFSSGNNGSSPTLRWPFQQWGADAVINGHDHTYERLLISDPTYDNFPFFITGLGGRSLYPFKAALPGSAVRYNADYGSMRITLSPSLATFTFYSVANTAQPIDVFELSNCLADCDRSTGPGVLDIFDFLCFQAAFVGADPYACDCDTSTGASVCDIFDFLCFQQAFVAGCP
jgi:Calcineurin-like phosphoesterase